jgi:hypothetical protein
MLADTRREVRNLTVMGMRPDISADQREVIRQLERSARAQVKFGLQALNLENRRRVQGGATLDEARCGPTCRRTKWEVIHNAERSARAELKLRIKALRYCRERQRGRR